MLLVGRLQLDSLLPHSITTLVVTRMVADCFEGRGMAYLTQFLRQLEKSANQPDWLTASLLSPHGLSLSWVTVRPKRVLENCMP